MKGAKPAHILQVKSREGTHTVFTDIEEFSG